VIDPSGRLVQHSDEGKGRGPKEEPGTRICSGNTVEHQDLFPRPASAAQHSGGVQGCDRKGTLRKRHERDAGVVVRSERSQPAMIQIATG
jgi:hypothetical protein